MVKLSILVCGLLATGLAMATKSVHLLWLISTDVMYSMMAPQVICVFFLSQHVNEYGACFSCALALLLRSLIGEPMIGLPDLLPLPWDKIQEDGHRQRLFPFRTAIMLIAIVALLVVSRLALWLSDKGLLKRKLRDHKGDVDLVYMAPVGTDMEGMGPNKWGEMSVVWPRVQMGRKRICNFCTTLGFCVITTCHGIFSIA